MTGGRGMVGKCLSSLVNSSYLKDSAWNLSLVSEWVFLTSKDCDLRDNVAVMKLFKRHRPTHIIHLAANVGGLFKNMREKVTMFRDNVRMNENVLEACHSHDVQRGIFVLTSCMYPHHPSRYPMDTGMIHESEPHPSNEGYAYAKRMLEMQCRNYSTQYQREYLCLIPVNLYGPGDNFNLEDSHVVPATIHKIYLATREGTDYTMLGTGKAERQFLYAYDFAQLVLKSLLEYKGTDTIICCNDEEVTVGEMIGIVAKHYNFQGKILKDLSKEDGCRKKTVDNSYLKKLFPDFRFTSLDKGLRKTVEWFQNNYHSCRK